MGKLKRQTTIEKFMMEKQKKIDHIHVLELKYGIKFDAPFNTRIYRCALPDCMYYNKAGDLLGKRFQCPTCLNDYIADRTALMKKKPHCPNCTKSTKAKVKQATIQDVEDRLKHILGLPK